MLLVLRALIRLLTFVLLAVLALAGLGAIVIAVTGGDPSVTRLIGLQTASDSVGGLLDRLESGGRPVAVALGALGAVALGLIVLIGTIVPTRERKFVLTKGANGRITARRRALRDVVAALVEQPRRLEASKVQVRPARRRAGGRLRLTICSPHREPQGDLESTARERLEPLTERFKIKHRVRVGGQPGGGRVR